MKNSNSIQSQVMDSKSLVCSAAESLVSLRQVEKLLGGIDFAGAERESLVGAIRSKTDDDLDVCTLYDLADFVPMAFVRVALVDTGVSFPTHFGRKDSQHRIRDYRRLDEIQIYREAIERAQSWWPVRPNDVRSVAQWSGTMAMVEKALVKGSKPKDLEIAPTLLNGPDESCPPLSERPTFPDPPWWMSQWLPKPWWKFW